MNSNDDALFWEFIKANGFVPEKYGHILELNRSVNDSVSIYLKDFDQLLLSPKVRYDELDKRGISGAQGHIATMSGVVIPKTLEAEDYFQKHNLFSNATVNNDNYYARSDDFDSVIIKHRWNAEELDQLRYSLSHNFKEYLIGNISKINDGKTIKRLTFYQTISDHLEEMFNREYEVVHDVIKNRDREFYLIKKKTIMKKKIS